MPHTKYGVIERSKSIYFELYALLLCAYNRYWSYLFVATPPSRGNGLPLQLVCYLMLRGMR